MKTKAAFFRFFAILVIVSLIHVNGLSQNQHSDYDLPLYYSYKYNQPAVIESIVDFEMWMICYDSFVENIDFCISLEDWMLGEALHPLRFNGFLPEMAEWMLSDGLDLHEEDWQFMEWMFEFEPFVVDELLQSIEMLQLEEWMFEVYKQKYDIYSDTQLEDWMLSIDFGLAGSY